MTSKALSDFTSNFADSLYDSNQEIYEQRKAHYFNDECGIVDFAIDVLNMTGKNELYPYQVRILNSFQKHRRVSVKSLRGVGKTAIGAIILLWFMACTVGDAKAITTASVWQQLEKYLWPEIRKWGLQANWELIGVIMRDSKELLKMSINLDSGTKMAFASSPGVVETIEGAHADNLLYVFDEAKIIPNAIFDAVEGAFSTKGTKAFMLTLSTPGAPLGRFYDIHRGRLGLENWYTESITLQEAIAADVIDIEHMETQKRLWGEDSALFKNHFLGEFAEGSDWGLIKLSWIQAANQLWLEQKNEKREGDAIYGVDPADTGMDKTAITKLIGNHFEYIKYYNEEVMQTISRLKKLGVKPKKYIDANGDEQESSDTIAIDGLGIGAGLYQSLRNDGYRIKNVKFSGKAVDRANLPVKDSTGINTFQNIRIAAYWAFREALDPDSPAYREIALPPDDMLTQDLMAHEWAEALGVIRMKEGKDKIRERIGRSPDGGDTVVIAWWLRSTSTRRSRSTIVRL